MMSEKSKSSDQYKVLSGTCPDERCRAKLYFPVFDKSVECTSCGQRHEKTSLQNVTEVTDTNVALHNLLRNVLLGNVKPQKGPESVKVLGLSNYVCKLLSPILTKHGMDKQTGKAMLLTAMGQPEIFDCGVLGDRAFLIDPEHLSVVGYGRDRSGSLQYLADTLDIIKEANSDRDLLVPIHADGDGHCLVHAVSRALVGRELFWHALRVNLLNHFRGELEQYKQLFKDFIDRDEWVTIMNECDPDFVPPDNEPLGLRNIHIFGLANVLRRPIILLDSLSGMRSLGDYSGVFLPGLVAPEKCTKGGILNKPLCIAWSSCGRNHFIPLVGIKGSSAPKLPRYLLQKIWGVPNTLIDQYIDFDDGMCVVGGDKSLQDRYLQRLVAAMEDVFFEKYEVHPSLVSDVHQFVYKTSGFVGAKLDMVIKATQSAVQENRLYRCLLCDAIIEYQLPAEWFLHGGDLYNLAIQVHGELMVNKRYSFPDKGAVCMYDKSRDELILDHQQSKLMKCTFCQGDRVRLVKGDGHVLYENGDRTLTPSSSTRCTCGFKHFWEGKEYDNFPEILPITLEWNDKTIKEQVAWFQYESDPAMNSNVYQVAQNVVQKHFPGEFGSERLVQKVVSKILRQTAAPEQVSNACEMPPPDPVAWSPEASSKIIITGQQHKSIHKEELTMSETEKTIKKKIETNAPLHQKKSANIPRSQSASSALRGASQASRSSPEKKPMPHNTGSAATAGQCDNTSPTTIAQQSGSAETTSLAASTTQEDKKIRIATSEGKQVMLSLKEDVTFSELQQKILELVGIALDEQKLRIGFPPRELKPAEYENDEKVILRHGDKITVETVAKTVVVPDDSGQTGSGDGKSDKMNWSMFDDNIAAPAESLLQSLCRTDHAGANSIDMSISSLAMLASLSGRDLWTYAQSNPHLFSVGGLFYKQVERDLGLSGGKHCTIPSLPGKVFRFNAADDRLELCLEPYGHFPVEPDIENKIKNRSPVVGDGSHNIKFGSSGAISRDDKNMVAFSGHGHSLKTADIRMPADLLETSNRGAKRMQTLCDPSSHQDSIAEETDEAETRTTDVDQGLDKDRGGVQTGEKTAYQKLGPGFSVISPAVNTANERVDVFRQLVNAIEKSVSDCDEFSQTCQDDKTMSASTSAAVGLPENPNTQQTENPDAQQTENQDTEQTQNTDTEQTSQIPSTADKEEQMDMS
ncbi:deubiquitinating protein VCPIP1-like isoform X2 [Gigantopelta aegis]|uniref:deubiquitinating protein VCPIP1-like isoform X2 n=1 Tax=Gigantopelta aegis TaxID=1735272 RepID=UPI001B887F51|nr:deubiquitinating protein VCPIP1-like isoform X2 [Gigantopelta aegis]